MYRFLDVMKVSAVGAILLSALAACNSKPESNPTPPPSDDDRVEVIIEQVVDGKVVDTRAVGRTDVVKYTGKTDGDDVAQIRWPKDVNCNKPFKFTYYAKPGLYLKAGGYRFNQTETPRMTTFEIDTSGQTDAIKKVWRQVTCNPEGHKKIYVRLEYENINNPNIKSDYDWMITLTLCPRQIRYKTSSGGLSVPYWRLVNMLTFTRLNPSTKDLQPSNVEVQLDPGYGNLVSVDARGDHSNYNSISMKSGWYTIREYPLYWGEPSDEMRDWHPRTWYSSGDVQNLCFEITVINDSGMYVLVGNRYTDGLGDIIRNRAPYPAYDEDFQDGWYNSNDNMGYAYLVHDDKKTVGYNFLSPMTPRDPIVTGIRFYDNREQYKGKVPRIYFYSSGKIDMLKGGAHVKSEFVLDTYRYYFH